MLATLRRCSPLLLLVLAALARAEDLPLLEDGEKARLLGQAQQLEEEAATMKNGAETKFTQDQDACYQKFLVNACISDAKKERVKVIQVAREKEAQARAIRREANARDLATQSARKAADAPREAAKTEEKVQQFHAEQSKAEQDRSQNQADLQRRAQEGHTKAVKDAQDRAKRLAEHNEEVAKAQAKGGNGATPEDEVRQNVADREKRVAEKTAKRLAKEQQQAADKAAWEAEQRRRGQGE